MSDGLISNSFGVPLINSALHDISVNIPHELRPVFAENKHLLPRFAKAVVHAVQASFVHPDTQMRQITQSEVRARVQLAYRAVIEGYFDEKLGMIQLLDILPDVLIDSMRMGMGAGEITDGRGQSDQARRWGVAGVEETFEVERSELASEDMNTGALAEEANEAEDEAAEIEAEAVDNHGITLASS